MLIAAIIIAVLIILILALAYIMFNICCARTPTPLIKFIIKNSMSGELDLGEDSKRGAEMWNNSDLEEVCLESRDGVKLYGYYRKHPNAKRAIILVHGYRMSALPTFAAVLPYYIEDECDILLIDQRTSGKSTGKYITFGITERYDAQLWTNWMCEKRPDLPVYLDGISMGAATVLAASEFTFPKNFAGIIADSGYTTPKEIVRHVISSYIPFPSAPLLALIAMMFRIVTGHPMDSMDCRISAAKSKYPIFFIHGKMDRFVPYTMCEENYAACTSEKSVFYSETAEHGMSFMADKDALLQHIRGFFANNDNLTEV
ncbi:MAG: alpha/beta hydrolase [Oscillospiraceae bacterium]|nr:alpha/beta hydrolase [Oscillospiraceae bacterium]